MLWRHKPPLLIKYSALGCCYALSLLEQTVCRPKNPLVVRCIVVEPVVELAAVALGFDAAVVVVADPIHLVAAVLGCQT